MGEARIAELQEQGVEVELVTIGNKGSTYFKKRATPVRKSMACTQAPSAAQATEIANDLLSSFYAGEFDRVELLYTTFVSMISSVPSIRTIVPLLPGGIEMEGDEIFKMSTREGQLAVEKEAVPAAEPKEFAPDMIFEQEPSQLLNAILPLYLNGQLLRTLQESVASELASRMSAMQSATDNAKDLQGRLEREMNPAPGQDHAGAHGDYCGRGRDQLTLCLSFRGSCPLTSTCASDLCAPVVGTALSERWGTSWLAG